MIKGRKWKSNFTNAIQMRNNNNNNNNNNNLSFFYFDFFPITPG